MHVNVLCAEVQPAICPMPLVSSFFRNTLGYRAETSTRSLDCAGRTERADKTHQQFEKLPLTSWIISSELRRAQRWCAQSLTIVVLGVSVSLCILNWPFLSLFWNTPNCWKSSQCKVPALWVFEPKHHRRMMTMATTRNQLRVRKQRRRQRAERLLITLPSRLCILIFDQWIDLWIEKNT